MSSESLNRVCELCADIQLACRRNPGLRALASEGLEDLLRRMDAIAAARRSPARCAPPAAAHAPRGAPAGPQRAPGRAPPAAAPANASETDDGFLLADAGGAGRRPAPARGFESEVDTFVPAVPNAGARTTAPPPAVTIPDCQVTYTPVAPVTDVDGIGVAHGAREEHMDAPGFSSDLAEAHHTAPASVVSPTTFSSLRFGGNAPCSLNRVCELCADIQLACRRNPGLRALASEGLEDLLRRMDAIAAARRSPARCAPPAAAHAPRGAPAGPQRAPGRAPPAAAPANASETDDGFLLADAGGAGRRPAPARGFESEVDTFVPAVPNAGARTTAPPPAVTIPDCQVTYTPVAPVTDVDGIGVAHGAREEHMDAPGFSSDLAEAHHTAPASVVSPTTFSSLRFGDEEPSYLALGKTGLGSATSPARPMAEANFSRFRYDRAGPEQQAELERKFEQQRTLRAQLQAQMEEQKRYRAQEARAYGSRR
eukprot:m51a1_g7734 hypothetical protein (483) ;mRNA; f:171866-174581